MPELSQDAIDELLTLVAGRHEALVRNVLPSLHSADIADVIDALDHDGRLFLYDLLPPETKSEVLIELDQRHREALVEEMEPREIGALVAYLDSDDAADLVGELDEPVQNEVLGVLAAEEAADIRTLLAYPEDSAGGIMASEFLCLAPAATVEAAIDAIREVHEDMPDIYNVYVAEPGPRARLQGRVSLRALLLAAAGTQLGTLTKPPKVTVAPDVDQEDVARLFRQYDAVEAPVIDADGVMLGRITVDDVVDVLEEEADEDIGRMTGTGDESAATDSVLHASGRRLPWLLAGLLGGLLAALALSRYELSLEELVSLAFFVPVINAMGGNVAMQSSSIAVRGLAVGTGAYRAIGRRLWKEFLVSLLNGLVCGVLLSVVVLLWLDAAWMSALIGVALFAVILISTTVGALVPVLLDRAGIDPALAAGPFVTTANDVLGILVYLSLAQLLMPVLR